MTRFLRFLLCAALASIPAQAAIHVWVADSLRRVRPQDAVEDTRRATVKAARNEWVSFQVVIRGGPGGLRDVNARAEAVGPARVALYREHYVEVKTPSPFSTDGPGWYPDALLPFLDGYKPGARLVAAPFEVEEERTRFYGSICSCPPAPNQPAEVPGSKMG